VATVSNGGSARRLSFRRSPILDRKYCRKKSSAGAEIRPGHSSKTASYNSGLTITDSSQIFHHLELTTMQHSPQEMIHDELSFRRWIRKECLIRLVTISTMLDNLFNIFNNVAPRYQWAELDLRFPTDDMFFRVATFEEFMQQGLSPQPPLKMKLKEAFMLLFTPLSTMTEYRKLQDANLTALDVQMLIYCILPSSYSC